MASFETKPGPRAGRFIHLISERMSGGNRLAAFSDCLAEALRERHPPRIQSEPVTMRLELQDGEHMLLVLLDGNQRTVCDATRSTEASVSLVCPIADLVGERRDVGLMEWARRIGGRKELLSHFMPILVSAAAKLRDAESSLRPRSDHREFVWVDDDEADACKLCSKRFTLLRRRHHCRRCGHLICDGCSRSRMGGSRTCDACTAKGWVKVDASSSESSTSATPDAQSSRGQRATNIATNLGSIGDSHGAETPCGACNAKTLELEHSLHACQRASVLSTVHWMNMITRVAHQVLVGGTAATWVTVLYAAAHLCTHVLQQLGWVSTVVDRGLPLLGFLHGPQLLFVLSVSFAYHRSAQGRWVRRIEVLLVCAIIMLRHKWTRLQTARLTPSDAKLVWDRNHDVQALYAYDAICRVRGLWVKTGQYLSSRADFMPRAYTKELGRLQDSAPASPWAEIKVTVERELQKPISAVFSEFDEEAVAAASIAQVRVRAVGRTQSRRVARECAWKCAALHARAVLPEACLLVGRCRCIQRCFETEERSQ